MNIIETFNLLSRQAKSLGVDVSDITSRKAQTILSKNKAMEKRIAEFNKLQEATAEQKPVVSKYSNVTSTPETRRRVLSGYRNLNK